MSTTKDDVDHDHEVAREAFVTKINNAVCRMREGPYPISLDEIECEAFISMLQEADMVSKSN